MTLSGPPPSTPEPIGPGGRRQRSGCLVALYVLFGLGALVLVLGGIAAWLFFRSETGQRVLEAAKEGTAWAQEAAAAPGTDALRQAGCDTAMVTTFGRVLDFTAQLLPPERAAEIERGEAADETLVICQLPLLSDTQPDCAEMARVYGSAVPDPPARFVVMVQRQGLRPRQCQGFYAPDGTLLDDLGGKGSAGTTGSP